MTPEEWKQLIPNREPWLWVDEVVSIDATSINTRKHLDPELDVFRGHYPGFPLLPGVLQCEACLEASAILIAHLGVTTGDRIPVATRMNNVKFRRMVRPGDVLDVHVRLVDRLQDTFYLKGRVLVDGKPSTVLDFTTSSAPAPGEEQA